MAYNLILQESIKTAIKNNDYNSVREFLTEDEFKKIKNGNFAILVDIVNKSTKLTPTNSKVENLYNVNRKAEIKKPTNLLAVFKSFFKQPASYNLPEPIQNKIHSGGATAICDSYYAQPKSGIPGASGMQGISGVKGISGIEIQSEHKPTHMTALTGTYTHSVSSGIYSHEQNIRNEWHRVFSTPPPPNERMK